ncbi:MAG: sugar transferase [Ilumatobacteraceae bacterium]
MVPTTNQIIAASTPLMDRGPLPRGTGPAGVGMRANGIPATRSAPPPGGATVDAAGRVEAGSSSYVRWIKPAVDRVGALALLVALAPLLLCSALGVYVALGRPVVFRQRRVGRNGQEFDIYKFRSMRPDRRSENRGAPAHLGERRRTHKSLTDPRLCGFGRFLRRSSLDELPQLWNVVRGEMSLVGPRPELVEIVARYEPWQHHRHCVKPGLTGLWQIGEHRDGEMFQHTAIDLRYRTDRADHQTFGFSPRTMTSVLAMRTY